MPPKTEEPMMPTTKANVAKRQGPWEPNDDDVKYSVLLILVALSMVSGQLLSYSPFSREDEINRGSVLAFH
jgi:hypothetical protein